MVPQSHHHAHFVAAPIGAVVMYAGPVAQVASTKNEAWNACNGTTPRPLARPSDAAAGPDSAAALLEARGWMACDGRRLRASAFPHLYAAIGTLYGGGDGYFNVPDLRGVFVRGVDAHAGVDLGLAQRRAPDGTPGYDGIGSIQCDALQTHVHDYDGWQATGLGDKGSPVLVAGQPTPTTAPTNARIADETRPRNMALYYIIRYA